MLRIESHEVDIATLNLINGGVLYGWKRVEKTK